MVVEEGNKQQNWCVILIVVTKYSKFGSGTTTFWLLKLFYGSIQFLVIILYLLICFSTSRSVGQTRSGRYDNDFKKSVSVQFWGMKLLVI